MSGLDFFAFLTIGLMFITAIAFAFLRYISKSRNHPERLLLIISIVSIIQVLYCLQLVGGFKGAANSLLGISLLTGTLLGYTLEYLYRRYIKKTPEKE
ncbi:YesK-like family protein [Bacillus pumilus]|uniref:YesK-like family protein n=1 Tax=Bacillus pumilus TaxID=1408 RepID=UPI00119D3B2B|nr:YesK-like family protein [Bacillus pumilus]